MSTFAGIIFERIEIVRIKDLDTMWKASLQEMSKCVKLARKDGANLTNLAKRVYGKTDPHTLKRFDKFMMVDQSISEHGFYSICDHSLEEMVEKFDCNFASTLPRVTHGTRVDDGRHRLSAMLANGYEHAVVAMCSIERFPYEGKGIKEKKAVEKKLHEDITAAAKIFGESEEFKNWRDNVIK